MFPRPSFSRSRPANRCRAGHTHRAFTFTSPSSLVTYVSLMLVLYETAMGFALFKLTDSAKLTDPNLYKEFDTPERANGLCVHAFHS
jgi:NOP5NT (NUC127) domain